MASPNSPPPEYLAEETCGPGLIAASVIMAIIGTVFVALRFYTRACIVHKLGLSDWTILIALIFSIGNSAGSIRQVVIGSTGRHIWTLSPEVVTPWLQTTYFTDISYILCLISIKISILVLYLRILSALLLRRLCYAALIIITILGAYSLITFIFMCVPVEAFWDPMNHPGAWCFPGVAKYYIDVGIHLLGEVIILVLPMPFLLSLDMPFRKKFGYLTIFAVGIILIIISIARLPSIIKFNSMTDPSWDAAPIAVWSAVELNVAIACACSMTLRPLAYRFFNSGAFAERIFDSINTDPGSLPSTIGGTRQKKQGVPCSGPGLGIVAGGADMMDGIPEDSTMNEKNGRCVDVEKCHGDTQAKRAGGLG